MIRMVPNKEINKIKLTVTTSCNQSCNYCFVKKTNERISLDIAKRSVDLLIKAHGTNKQLAIYGGEPLLEFALIKQLVVHANNVARKNKKKLTISLCTNLTLLTDDIVEFLKENNIKVTVSLVGPAKVHDTLRYFRNTSGTYERVVKNLRILAGKIPRQNIGISYVIIPSMSHKIYDNFMHIVGLGISNNINLEIIHDFEAWESKDRANFVIHFKRIINKMFEQIRNNNPIFINTINWEISRGTISGGYFINCPFNYFLEIYPSGQMAFSPFLLNRKDKSNFVVGDLKDKHVMTSDFAKCNFNKKNKKCLNCQNDYFGRAEDNCGSHFIRKYYNLLSLKAAKKIKSESCGDKKFKTYVDYIEKHLSF